MKLKTQLDQLRKARPKHSEYGQMYRRKSELDGAWRQVILHTLFLSDENTHLIRGHVFSKNQTMSAREWHAWFSEHLEKIHKKAVLDGMYLRTGKQWAVQKILGWHPYDRRIASRAAVARRGRKARSKARTHG